MVVAGRDKVATGMAAAGAATVRNMAARVCSSAARMAEAVGAQEHLPRSLPKVGTVDVAAAVAFQPLVVADISSDEAPSSSADHREE